VLVFQGKKVPSAGSNATSSEGALVQVLLVEGLQ
jgi:hypothetical protein